MVTRVQRKNNLALSTSGNNSKTSSKVFKESSNRSEKYYKAAEVNTILEGATGWFRVYLYTMFMTGMRTSEGLAMEWRNINFKNKL